jgi:hypothetical protein
MSLVNVLTERAQALLVVFLLSAFSYNAFASDVVVEMPTGGTVEISAEDMEMVAKDLDDEAEKSEDKKKKNYLKKIAQSFSSYADQLREKREKRLANLTDEQKEKRKIRKLKFHKVLRGIGYGATWVSINTARPFMSSAGFLTGLFQKPDKDKEAFYFLQFFLNHSQEFDNLYKEVGTFEEYAQAFQHKMEEIIILKAGLILNDAMREITGDEMPIEVIYKSIGVEPYASDENIKTIIESIDIFDIDESKIHPSLINEHPEYQELRPLLGDVTMDDVLNLIMKQDFPVDVEPAAILGGSTPKLYEGLMAYMGKLILPKLIISKVSASAASWVTTIGVVADIGAVTSALVCSLHKKTKDAMESDAEVKEFCSYVVNQSAYKLVKARAKGFVAGKKFRKKLIRLKDRLKLKFKKRKKIEELLPGKKEEESKPLEEGLEQLEEKEHRA